MMFEADRLNVPRAYLPLSGDNAADLSIALTWLAGTGLATGQGIGVQIPSRNAIRENPALRDLDRRGLAAFATWRHSSANKSVTGPQLSFFPDLEMLLALEDRKTTALVVLGVHDSHRAWVSAYDVPSLGVSSVGEVPAPAPILMAALETFTNSVNSSTGITDPRDKSRVVDGLQKLKRAGVPFTQEQLVAGALRHNWRGPAAFALGTVGAEILAGKQKRVRETYRDNIVDLWREEVGT